jgi:hypothetical protein
LNGHVLVQSLIVGKQMAAFRHRAVFPVAKTWDIYVFRRHDVVDGTMRVCCGCVVRCAAGKGY